MNELSLEYKSQKWDEAKLAVATSILFWKKINEILFAHMKRSDDVVQ